MEIAVAKDSPLGQYFAELDGVPTGSGFAAELRGVSASEAPAQPKDFTVKRTIWSLCSRIRELVKFAALRVELQSVEAVYGVLDEAWPSWRDEHVVEILSVSTEHGRLLLGEMVFRAGPAVKWLLMLVMPVIVATCAYRLAIEPTEDLSGIYSSYLSLTRALGVLACCGVAIELGYQGAVVRVHHQVRRLYRSVKSLQHANDEFERSFQSSLDVIKKAELASRGYRIGGTFLPPIGRLEKTTDRLRCRELRRLLRTLNEQLTQLASTDVDKAKSRAEASAKARTHTSDEIDEGANAPSLLVTALSKRHALASMLFENAVRSSLLQLALPLWEVQRVEQAEPTHLIARMNDCLHRIDTSCQRLEQWKAMLYRHTIQVAAVLPLDAEKPIQCDNDEQEYSRMKTKLSHDQTDHQRIEDQLQELFAACETLSGLVTAARHELHSNDSYGVEATIDFLIPSRDLMTKRVQELHEAWEAYDKELECMGSPSSTGEDQQVATSDDLVVTSEETNDKRKAQPKSDEDANKFTYVFTGTSTGEKEFDLKDILRQQEQESKPVGAFFVRELRDVLAYREANAQTITKEVDRDAADSSKTKDVSCQERQKVFLPIERRSFVPPAIDLNASIQSELRNLKLPFVGEDEEVLSDGVIEQQVMQTT